MILIEITWELVLNSQHIFRRGVDCVLFNISHIFSNIFQHNSKAAMKELVGCLPGSAPLPFPGVRPTVTEKTHSQFQHAIQLSQHIVY